MNKAHVKTHEKRHRIENNQIITAWRIERRVQEMTMNEKLTGLRWNVGTVKKVMNSIFGCCAAAAK